MPYRSPVFLSRRSVASRAAAPASWNCPVVKTKRSEQSNFAFYFRTTYWWNTFNLSSGKQRDPCLQNSASRPSSVVTGAKCRREKLIATPPRDERDWRRRNADFVHAPLPHSTVLATILGSVRFERALSPHSTIYVCIFMYVYVYTYSIYWPSRWYRGTDVIIIQPSLVLNYTRTY